MTDKEEAKEHVEFDQMELHSDIDIHAEPEIRRESPVKKSGNPLLPLMTVLALLALGGSGYLFYRYRLLSEDYQQLENRVQDATNTLAATNSDLQATHSDLGKTATTLESTKTTLADTRSNMDRLDGALRSAQNMNTRLEKEKNDLIATLAERDKELGKTKKSLTSANNQLAKNKKTLRRTQTERDRLKKDKATLQEQSTLQITKLETDLEDQRARSLSQLKTSEDKYRKQKRQLDKATEDLEQAHNQFKAESKASLQIIKERSQLKKDKTALEAEVNKLRVAAKADHEKISRLENVNFGDLVPYSEEIQPARATYQEPLPDGIKIPRRLGSVTLMVLVTEVGSVEKAFLLPGQELEPTLSVAVIRNIYKWKFSPPQADNVRVKTWQPVVVHSK